MGYQLSTMLLHCALDIAFLRMFMIVYTILTTFASLKPMLEGASRKACGVVLYVEYLHHKQRNLNFGSLGQSALF